MNQMLASYNNVSRELTSYLELYPNYFITFLGHSSGAGIINFLHKALAAIHTVFAIQREGYLKSYLRSKIGLIGFCSPRIGNAVFAQIVQNSGFRFTRHITNTGDVVPLLPPAWAGYAHYSEELLIDTINNNSNPFPSICNSKIKNTDPCMDRKSFFELLAQPNMTSNLNYQHNHVLGVSLGDEGACHGDV